MFELIFTSLFSLGLTIGVWLVLRRPMLWYCRTNEIVENQQRIISLLEKIADKNQNETKQKTNTEQVECVK